MHTKFTPEQIEGEFFTTNDLALAINELCEAIEALEAQVATLTNPKP
jgi:hypothetical protein